MREITETYLHYGFPRVLITLRREGWTDNHTRVHCLYCDEGLAMRQRRPRRNKSAILSQPLQVAGYPNQAWGMDFVSDALFDGKRLRLLTVIDLYTRECLNANWFLSLNDAQVKVEQWRTLYNELRPHSSLGWLSSVVCAEKHGLGVSNTE